MDLLPARGPTLTQGGLKVAKLQTAKTVDGQASGSVNLTDLRIGKPGRSGPPWLRVTAGTAGLTSRSPGGVSGGVPVSGAVPGPDVEGVPGSNVEGVTAGAEGVTGPVSVVAGGDASVGVVGSAGVDIQTTRSSMA